MKSDGETIYEFTTDQILPFKSDADVVDHLTSDNEMVKVDEVKVI